MDDTSGNGHNGSWWVLVLAMLRDREWQENDRKLAEWFEAEEAFEAEARNCPHLEVEQNGNAYEHICHHPTRDDPSDWVMCSRAECPLWGLNAAGEERGLFEAANVADALAAPIPAGSAFQGPHLGCNCAVEEPKRPDGTCEGCTHLSWEHDMGASYPTCTLGMEPGGCGRFKPSALYRMSTDAKDSSTFLLQNLDKRV